MRTPNLEPSPVYEPPISNPIIETFKTLIWRNWDTKPKWLELKQAQDPKASFIIVDWRPKKEGKKPRHLRVRILEPSQTREIPVFKRKGYIVFLAIHNRPVTQTRTKLVDIIAGHRKNSFKRRREFVLD